METIDKLEYPIMSGDSMDSDYSKGLACTSCVVQGVLLPHIGP